MAQTFDVKVLTEKEWNTLIDTKPPCEHVDEDSWGYADPEKRLLRVRNTKVHELNKYLLSHEFNHLMEDEATDVCEHGIRHKKFFKQVALPILGAIGGSMLLPGIGTALGATAGGGISTALGIGGAALGGGLGSKLGGASTKQALISGGLSGLTAGIGKALPAIGNALKGGAGGVAGGGASITGQAAPQASQLARGASITGSAAPQASQVALGSSLSSPASRLASGIRNPFPNGIPGAPFQSGPGSSTQALSRFSVPNAPVASVAPSIAQGVGQAGSLTIGAGGGGGGGAPGGAGSLIDQFLNKIKSGAGNVLQNAAGSAISGGITNAIQGGNAAFDLGAAGALIGAGQSRETPQIPDFNALPSVQRVQGAANAGYASDIGRVARTRLDEQLGREYTGLSENVASAIRRPYQEQKIQAERNLKAYQPGFNLDDPEYNKAIEPALRGQADALALNERAERENFELTRRQDIQTALGMDERQLGTLFDLANLDIQEISLQAGIDFETARQFKEQMGQLAGMFATRGLGLNRFKLEVA